MTRKKIIFIAGARPNFVKVAPLISEIKRFRRFNYILVHTGQHYNFEMSRVFFQDLEIPKPDYDLGVGSGSHAWQTGKIMIEFEKVCLKEKPHLVIVVGDVNSTLACSLVAVKLDIPVAHVEAGLRSFDREMPEEINRVVTDSVSSILFTHSEEANRNLIKEGISRKKIFFVGNVMIDTLLESKVKSQKSRILERLKLKKEQYAVLTLHRPSNVDKKNTLENLLRTFKIISQKIPIIFPAHPRTAKQIRKFHLNSKFHIPDSRFQIISPLGYLDMLYLVTNSKFVMTDSGGIQEETTILGVPCLTLRKNTERPVTVTHGTNTVVGINSKRITSEVKKILSNNRNYRKRPKLWDGRTAGRIVRILDKVK